MQHLSLGQLLGAVAVQPDWSQFQGLLQRPEMKRLIVIGLVLLVISQAVQIFCWWGSSLALGRKETATLRNAFNVWVGMLMLTIIGIFAVEFIGPFLAQVREPWRIASTWGGLALLSVVLFFLIPMKIHGIGFWRTLGILVLSAAMQSIVMGVLIFVTGAIFISAPDRAALQQVQNAQIERWEMEMDRLAGRNPSAEITRLLSEALATPRPSLWRREAIVRALQRRLDRQRRSLRPGDYETNAEFRRQLDSYLLLLQEVKAERANSAAPQAAYGPVENRTSLVA